MKKELCEWSRAQLKEHFDQLQTIVSKPVYICPKCGRVANRKKWLTTFDFCGSSIPSIANYFKSYGAEPTTYVQLKTSNKVLSTMKAIKDKIS